VPQPAPPPTELHPAFTTKAITCDGEPTEPEWNSAARTGSFLDERTHLLVRPYSDTRLLADSKNLYLLLYAADEDVRTRAKGSGAFGVFDHFTVQIRNGDITYHLEIAPNRTTFATQRVKGVDKPWAPHLQLGADIDGTLDNPKDEDEEWVIESALPLASLKAVPGAALRMSVERCDTPKSGVQSCGSWGLAVDGTPVGLVVLPSALK